MSPVPSDRLPGIVRAAAEEGRLLTLPEVARALNVSRSHVYALTYRGRLSACRVGGALRFHPDALAALLDGSGDV